MGPPNQANRSTSGRLAPINKASVAFGVLRSSPVLASTRPKRVCVTLSMERRMVLNDAQLPADRSTERRVIIAGIDFEQYSGALACLENGINCGSRAVLSGDVSSWVETANRRSDVRGDTRAPPTSSSERGAA